MSQSSAEHVRQVLDNVYHTDFTPTKRVRVKNPIQNLQN